MELDNPGRRCCFFNNDTSGIKVWSEEDGVIPMRATDLVAACRIIFLLIKEHFEK